MPSEKTDTVQVELFHDLLIEAQSEMKLLVATITGFEERFTAFLDSRFDKIDKHFDAIEEICRLSLKNH